MSAQQFLYRDYVDFIASLYTETEWVTLSESEQIRILTIAVPSSPWRMYIDDDAVVDHDTAFSDEQGQGPVEDQDHTTAFIVFCLARNKFSEAA